MFVNCLRSLRLFINDERLIEYGLWNWEREYPVAAYGSLKIWKVPSYIPKDQIQFKGTKILVL